MSKIDVSIVMTYFERKKQLFNTIKSFAMHGYERVEVIVVDDASSDEPISEEELSCLAPLLSIRLIRLDPMKKTYVNPCIPFNVGLTAARGRFIIIQNAECIHVGDVVSYCRNHIDDKRYLSFGCFSVDKEAMLQITSRERIDKEFLEQYLVQDVATYTNGANGWYNHSIYKPVGYHFTAAITKNNLKLLNGFDVGFDDDEILERIRRLGLNVEIIDDVPVLHQWHYKKPKTRNVLRSLRTVLQYERNGYLFNFVSKKDNVISYWKFSIRYQVFRMTLPFLMTYSFFSILIKFLFLKINELAK